ncbi:hypothetical protein ES705_43402 [subsurface metagenome]|jgi:hypothetical protein
MRVRLVEVVQPVKVALNIGLLNELNKRLPLRLAGVAECGKE